ncbi:tRNA (adenosine(37)-N6)-threonylcarbamoyltransferase complex dimerization subunit type 1 TsaB [Ureaplasma sp. ES3154-GEN]|uniref:tRNA (adenosine(37)-N6)-threonylcarbamoyltransferase complex dimerization subunit type 1 TsaB n=1 Tax=Ureaplasma sp. ES3154-GEN TaxID=2984844 RepID=UPI0021E92E66|nr:tRNA (adenosine(37)-N6)-threonylcarbamoyltransferase complex dimerization subunit type 1 TsaB [Ureaplasma sp. ES3154-GEN]MCV3743701.1 tRNA (adenosine(37)-N6)-threonylcarbamoyltransferase complex dimerization subunit type 1 TsaB [Ureaplasma sp. ES3154-GEN]
MKNTSLFLDLTSKFCIIGLYDINQQLIASEIRLTNNNLTDIVNQIIFNLFEENNLSIEKNLQAIYLNNGPGSFTGLRVASIIAKTLMITYDINLYVCDHLKLLTKHITNTLAFLDAKGDKMYAYHDQKYFIIKKNDVDKYMLNHSDLIPIVINEQTYDYQYLLKNLPFELFTQVKNIDEYVINYVKQPV